MRDQALRFILEQPSNDGNKGSRRKRARLVTACDSCRAKKIRCTPSTEPSADAEVCEACHQAGGRCEFSDRDRYHAERGVSLSDLSGARDTPASSSDDYSEGNLPKRRRLSSTSRPEPPQISSPAEYHGNHPPPLPPYGIDSQHQAQAISGASTSTVPAQPIAPVPLKRILVPFFRYFGPTANTPGYRRVRVRTLTLSDDHGEDRSRETNHWNNGSRNLNGLSSFNFANGTSSIAGPRPSSASSNAYHRPSSSSSTRSIQHVGSSPSASSPALNHQFVQPSPISFAQPRPRSMTEASASSSATTSPPMRTNNAPGLGPPPEQPSLTQPQHFRTTLNVENSLPSMETSHLFDSTRPRYPNQNHFLHLVSIFFDNLACHFPFLDRATVARQAEEGSLSAILANCIAGLAVRFSDREELLSTGPRYSAGEPFCDMAKLLIVHLLSWPSLEVLQALILIAWAEFGSGRDSGLWMYSRMAVGMSMDLGINHEATIMMMTGPQEQERVRLTWWAVILIDRINSWGTGRPIAITDDQFDTVIPTCDEFAGEDLSQPPPPSFVFGHLCRLVQFRGKMGDVLNKQTVQRKEGDFYPVGLELSELQSQMTFFYQSLPPSLLFTMQNFRRFSKHEQASTFILLHVMFHSVITLLHQPALLRNFTPNVALPLASNVDLSRSSARSIVDMILLANEVDEKALISNPFLDLPILTAARGFLADRELFSQINPHPQGNTSLVYLRLQWGESNLERCKEVLGKMSAYWGGVGCVKTILDQQSSGSLDFDIGEGAQPDSRIDYLRDVELIKQWAANAWRRQRPTHAPSSPLSTSRNGLSPRVASAVPLLPIDHNNLQYGSAARDVFSASPEDTAIGITGFLDGALLDPMAGPSGWATDPLGGADALRISFNSAEADLSFGNYSSELFSISEGFEEFLASHATPSGLSSAAGMIASGSGSGATSNGTMVHANGSGANPVVLAAQLEAVSGATNLVGLGPPQQPSHSLPLQHAKHGSSGESASTSSSSTFAPYGTGHIHDYFPVFSSLGLPMPLTRAPSPTPHFVPQHYQNHDHQLTHPPPQPPRHIPTAQNSHHHPHAHGPP